MCMPPPFPTPQPHPMEIRAQRERRRQQQALENRRAEAHRHYYDVTRRKEVMFVWDPACCWYKRIEWLHDGTVKDTVMYVTERPTTIPKTGGHHGSHSSD